MDGHYPAELDPAEALRRFEWARRRGHPLYVWPEVAIEDWVASCRAVERALTAGLADPGGRVAVVAPAGPLALGVAAYTTGCGAILGRWLERGCASARPDTAAILEDHLRHGRKRARRLADLLRHVAEVFRGAEVEAVLIKGGQTAATLFDEPALRPMADLDLLVAPGELTVAEEALRAVGFTRTVRQTRPVRSSWRPPGDDGMLRSVHVPHAGNPVSVDLHFSLARDFYGVGRIDPGRPEPFDLVPVPGAPEGVHGLDDTMLFVVLAAHASEDLHNLQLVRLAELALVGRRIGERDRWGSVLERIGAAGSPHLLYPALALADRLAPGALAPDLVAWARSTAPAVMRRVVDELTPGTAQRLDRLRLVERFMWARTPGDVVRRLGHMMAPASAGGSLRSLAAVYRDRAYRVIRGRVGLSGASRELDE
jgi:hypothetical protein